VPAAALGLGGLLLFGMREQQRVDPRANMNTIQLETPAGYAAKDIVIDTNERRVAGMDHYLYRVFQKDTLDPGFSVYVGYYDYQVQGKTIHSPKNCLPGAGWEALESEPRVVRVGDRDVTVNRYLLSNKGAQALVYYWYQGRGRVEASEYTSKLYMVADAIRLNRTDAALVRIITPITGEDASHEEAARRRAREFAQLMFPALSTVIPS
jgi:EpsI family protein